MATRYLFDYVGVRPGRVLVHCNLCGYQMQRRRAVWHAKQHEKKGHAKARRFARSEPVEDRYMIAASSLPSRAER